MIVHNTGIMKLMTMILLASFVIDAQVRAEEVASEISYQNKFQLLDENLILMKIKGQKDQRSLEEMYSNLEKVCPFRNNKSELSNLLPGAITLNMSAKLTDEEKAECDRSLQGFNESIDKTQNLQNMINREDGSFTEQDKARLEIQLQNTMFATSGLRTMLEAKCKFDGPNSISSVSNQLINVVDSGSATLSFVNPFAALIGAAAAATGRLAVSLGNWIFDDPPDKVANEINESERFIDDLCSFRDLAQKYDKVISNPFDVNIKATVENRANEIAERTAGIEKKLEETKHLRMCVENFRIKFDKLQSFSNEIFDIVKNPVTQMQCLKIMSKLKDLFRDKKVDPLHSLAQSYQCGELRKGEVTLNDKVEVDFYKMMFCKNLNSIEEFSNGDIYTKCEEENFQKMVLAKMTNISDLLFRKIDEDFKMMSPANEKLAALKKEEDELQLLRINEEKRKLSLEQFAGVGSIIDLNPMTNVNISKAMDNLGKTILGPRLDVFADKAFKSSDKDIEEASDYVEEIFDLKNKIEGKGLFSFSEDQMDEKKKTKIEMCNLTKQAEKKLINGYRSSAGVKDICDFTKGDGIPPLKSRGVNYEIYAGSKSDSDESSNSLTIRCNAMIEKAQKNFSVVKDQLKNLSHVDCR